MKATWEEKYRIVAAALVKAEDERDEARRYANELEARCDQRDLELAEARQVARQLDWFAQPDADYKTRREHYLARFPWLTDQDPFGEGAGDE